MKLGLYVRLDAKLGQQDALKAFLKEAEKLAMAEASTPVWFAVQFSQYSFGIFDAFDSEDGHQAHLKGQIASMLMQRAEELLSTAPKIEPLEVIASKISAN